ncbi:TM0996/MTH895 family glutaredoxin-like protein [candidate division KSB1 bacterium]|nr:TM0996/MTH895 family glutaredoxin-like protein [candidate division KSB1 bacterium]MBL7092489.1 TM0996/MTH895 family glutaredoxin-like protein [candidate division KSB1 bacterium]
MTIKILGTGCAKCDKLEAMAKQAVDALNWEAKIEKVKDLNEIMDYGVMMTPGLVINEQVKTSGKLPTIEQIKGWIQEAN